MTPRHSECNGLFTTTKTNVTWVLGRRERTIVRVMTLARFATTALLGLIVSAMIGCTRRPPTSAKLDTELLQASRRGDIPSLRRLLRQGAKIDARDEGGSTAVAIAADFGHRDAVKLLLDKGADPVAGGISGESALVEAAQVGYATKIALILERGVSQKAMNDALFTLADSAPAVVKIVSTPGPIQTRPNLERPDIDYAKCVGLLLDYGANIEAQNEVSETPLMWAAQHGQTEVVRALLERGAAVDVKDKYGNTALIGAACECAVIDMPETLESMKLLLGKGAQANAKNKVGGTALMAAASAGRTENMRLLLDSGAEVDLKDDDGNTALLVSAGAGPYTPVGVAYTKDPVNLLLERGANIRATNKKGDTALMLAASNSGYEDAATVKLLLDRGAEAGSRNKHGQTALDLALKNHRTEAASLLRKATNHNPTPAAESH